MRKAPGLILSTFFAMTILGQTPQTAEAYLQRSLAQFQRGDTEAALTDVTKAIELNPTFADAFALRAAIRNSKGDKEGTLADYNRVIELVPNASGIETVYTNRSMLRLQRGDVDGALTDLAYEMRGIVRLIQGQEDQAKREFQRSLELDPRLGPEIVEVKSRLFKTSRPSPAK
jgi:Tfp pilus assembly protein PilF